MLIPSLFCFAHVAASSLSRRVNANSQLQHPVERLGGKLIKKGEC